MAADDRSCDPVYGGEASRFEAIVARLSFFQPLRSNAKIAFRSRLGRLRRFSQLGGREWPSLISRRFCRSLGSGERLREFAFDDGRRFVFELFENARQLFAMRRDESIENCCGNTAKVFAQILVVAAVRNSNYGRYVNKQLVNDQSLHAKCDEFFGRQAAEVTQFICFCSAGRDVLIAKNRRERQILARQL